jgi:MFS family permease
MRSLITPRFTRAWIANFFSDLSFSMFVHFAGFLAGLGAGEAIIGSVASVAAVTAIVTRPRAGVWMDQYGRIRVVRIAAVVRICVTLTFLLVGAMGPLVYVLKAIHLSMVAITFTGLITYASDAMPPDRRAQGIAWYGLSGMVAVAIGPQIGDRLVGGSDYTGLFLGIAAAESALLVALFTMKAMENPPKVATPGGSLGLLRFRPLVPVWLMMAGFGLGFGSVLNFMRTFVDEADIGAVGPYFTSYSVTAIITRVALSSLPERIGERRVLIPAIGAYALGFGLLSITTTSAMLWAAAGVAGIGHAFMFPIMSSLVVDRAPPERRANAMSLYTAMFDLGPLIGAPIIGLSVELWGYSPTWLGLGVAIAAIGVVFVILDKPVAGASPPRPQELGV